MKGIRERLREANQTIERELADERARALGQEISVRALGIGLLVALVGILAVLLLPLSSGQRMGGLAVILFVAFLLFSTVMRVGSRRYRVHGPAFMQAIFLRSILWLPVSILLVGLVDFAVRRSVSTAATDVFPILLGLLIGMLFMYWYQGRRLSKDEGE